MLTFITLTRTSAQGGGQITVNADAIDMISVVNVASNRPDRVATLLRLRSGHVEYVTDHPDDILTRMVSPAVVVVDDPSTVRRTENGPNGVLVLPTEATVRDLTIPRNDHTPRLADQP